MAHTATSLIALSALFSLSGCMAAARTDAGNWSKGRVRNPYEQVDWKRDKRICSTTHLHLTTQKHFDHAYTGGLRHFAVSNYYPSVPYYPLDAIRQDQFKVRQDHPVVVNGHLQQGPFSWNEIILDKTTGWYDEIDPSLRKNLPFQMGDYIFRSIPADITQSPNAEHHAFTNSPAHINCPGSAYSSGTFDVGWKKPSYQLDRHGYAIGTSLTWQQAFDQMLEKLQYPDGGGITINHPVWSRLEMAQILQMLDYDDGVLGIEIWNETCENKNKTGFALEMWDTILATGRRCYGFSVPDHTAGGGRFWKGRNYLLVPKVNERECLKAYRDGRFYCALLGNDLKFNEITFAHGTLSATLNKQALIRVISDKGIVAEDNATSITYPVPVENQEPTLTYIRVEAEDGTGERIFSQPIMFGSNTTPARECGRP